MEIDAIDIRNIIFENQDNIAFIIGNGIHYQYHDCDISWKELLISLWKEYFGEKKEIPEGISMTEFFDIIEMNIYNKRDSRLFSLKEGSSKASIKDLQGIKFDDLMHFVLKYVCRLPSTCNAYSEATERFRTIYKDLVALSRRWCIANIEDATQLSDDACVNQIMNLLTNEAKRQILINSVKKTVSDKFPSKKVYNLKTCIDAIKDINAPILTTNFDTYISESVNATLRKLKLTDSQYKFTDFYPWNVYYSDQEIDNPLYGFAVWHINGTIKYPRSIKLGLSDYMGCVERARRMIQGQNFNEYFGGKNQAYWVGYNTWLHIIFNKDLFIFGLGLEENEVFLRWLLIQRAKYCKMYNKPLKGWYIGKKDMDINDGKKFFLEQLGFKVIEISDYKTLYQALETL